MLLMLFELFLKVTQISLIFTDFVLTTTEITITTYRSVTDSDLCYLWANLELGTLNFEPAALLHPISSHLCCLLWAKLGTAYLLKMFNICRLYIKMLFK